MQSETLAEDWFAKNTLMKQAARKRSELRAAKEQEKAAKINWSDPPPIDADEEWYRHHNWKEKRARVLTALHDASTSHTAISSFVNCGAECTVEWSETKQRYRVVGSFCHNRHCEPCMKAKSSLITNNLRDKLKDRKKRSHRFITLTLRHSNTPLADQIARLYDSYKKLRKTKLWKNSQKGGAATLEVKFQPYTKQWHPHLHIISEGNFISTYDLSSAWHAITTDSYMVDVRAISQAKDVAFYVGKYVTKGTNAEVWENPDAAKEWVTAVRGVRMCATFGTWRGFKLLERKRDPEGTWKAVATLSSLARRARAGEIHAINLLLLLEEEQQYNPNRKRHPKRE